VNVAGVVLSTRPERRDEVRAAAARLPGVEVHFVTEDGRLLVTVEDETGQSLLALHRLDGVLAASLAYHHFEPDPAGGIDGESNDAANTA
jgi:nitrate reductase NapD